MATIADTLTALAISLASTQVDDARYEAELLLAYVLAVPRSHLYAYPEQHLTQEQNQQLYALVNDRNHGVPMAYLLGERDFGALPQPLQVSAATLIPRPETELLVQAALSLLPQHESLRIADLGTGSGAIALSLAYACSQWQIDATDNSTDALAIARQNAQRLKLLNIQFKQGDWCAALGMPGAQYAAIVTNPPYLAADDPHLLQGDLRFEPQSALVSGMDGLDAIRQIVATAVPYLTTGGYLLIEHGHRQSEQVQDLLTQQSFALASVLTDLAGHARVVVGQKV